MLCCGHKPDFILISISGFESTLIYFCQSDTTGLCILTSPSSISPLILVPDLESVVCLLRRLQACTKKKHCGWFGFFFLFIFLFPSFSGNGKIGALLGAAQQEMFQGQQIPVLLPSGTEESITGPGWRLIRRGNAWPAYQKLDTKPFSVHLSPSCSKWEDICSGIQGNTSSVAPLS